MPSLVTGIGTTVTMRLFRGLRNDGTVENWCTVCGGVTGYIRQLRSTLSRIRDEISHKTKTDAARNPAATIAGKKSVLWSQPEAGDFTGLGIVVS